MQRFKSLITLLAFAISWQHSLSQNIKLLPPDPGKLDYAWELEQKALKNKDSVLLGEAYYIMGKIYTASGDLPKAQHYFLKALRILEPRGPSFEVSRLYMRLSALSASKHATRQLVEKAFRASQAAGDQRGALIARTTLDQLKVAEEVAKTGGPLSPSTYREVFRNFEEVKNYHVAQQDTLGVADMNELIGSLLMDQGENEADIYFERADAGFRSLRKPVQQTSCQINLARSKLKQGDIKKAGFHLQLAEKYYAMGDAKVMDTEENFAEVYVSYFEALDNWEKVAEWQKRLMEVSRNINETERQNAYARLNLEYQTEINDAKLKAQTNELALKSEDLWYRNAYLLALSVLLVVSMITGVGYYRLSQKYKGISNHNAHLVHEQNHRVKNNLQLVSSLLYLQASRIHDEEVRLALEESQLRIDVMAALQRKLYENEHMVSIPMRSFITEIVEMSLSAFGYNYIEVEYEISPSLFLKTDKAMSVGLIINELVTNACKHAFSSVDTPTMQIHLWEETGVWYLRVADNGKVSWNPGIASLRSFGKRLIEIQAVQLMSNYEFTVENGTSFIMSFPSADVVV